MASGTETGVNVKAIVVVLLGLASAGALAFVTTRDTPAPQEAELIADDVSAAAPDGPEAPDPTSDAGQPEAPVAQAAPQTEAPALAGPPAEPEPPRFDQIRVAPDGSTVIAGQAAPDVALSFRLDGDEVATARSSSTGEFAAILSLEPSDRPRIMSLVARGADGAEVTGEESAIIAPFGLALADPAAPVAPDATPSIDAQTADAPETGTEVEPGAGAAPATDPDGASATAEVAPPEAPDEDAAPRDGAQASADMVEPVARPGTDQAAVAPAPGPGGSASTAAEAPPAVAQDRSPAAGPAPDPDAPVATGPVAQTTVPQTPAAPDAVAPPETGAQPQRPPAAREADAPAIVVAGPEGVRVVQDTNPPPRALTSVQIDAITYTTDGDVAVSGRGPADRQVRILLNNQEIRMGEIGPGGAWSLELPDVDPGTYTLTVAQLSPGGEVETRAEIPFLREDPARIAASPMRAADGVSVITVQPGFTLWGIAEANFGSGIAYVQIFEENEDQIRDPDLIFPGQIFALPDLPRDPVE